MNRTANRTAAMVLVIAGICLFAWPQQGWGQLGCCNCCVGQGGCFGRSAAGVAGGLFGCCGGGSGGSRSATNFGYGRISRRRSAFVPAPPVCGAAPTTYPPVPVLGGVGGVVTAPPALPVAPYTPPPVATAPIQAIPSVPAPASVIPYVPPTVMVPQIAPAVPCAPCPCPAPVCVPCTPCDSYVPECGVPVETCVPCQPCGGPEFIVPSNSCDPCGPALAPACDCGPY